MRKKNIRAKIGSGKVVAKRYEILRRLGGGGSGEVFVVKDLLDSGHLKALKLLSDDSSDEQISVFKKEYNLVRQLSHPGIVKVEEHGVSRKYGSYMTMEYIQWPTLNEIGAQLKLEEIYTVLFSVANTLALLHKFLVAHYDLKPDNILVNIEGLRSDKDPTPVITMIGDFGSLDKVKSKKTDQRLGSITYSAPELFQGIQADQRCDIYSFARIAYNLIVEKGIEPTNDPQRILELKGYWMPEVGEWLESGTPEDLASILNRSLNTEPQFRPDNLTDIISLLSKNIATESKPVNYLTRLPFTGRSGEMRFLGNIFHEVNNSEQWAFQFMGKEGIGKSRIIEEFALSKQSDKVRILKLNGNNLRSLMNFLELERVNDEADPSQWEEIYSCFEEKCSELIPHESLIVCWSRFSEANPDTLQLFKQLFLRFKNFPVLWLIENETDSAELAHLSYYDRFIRRELKPLGEEDIRNLIGALLHHPPGWENLAGNLIDVCSGKPGWLKYLLNKVLESRQLIYDGGKWQIPTGNIDLEKCNIDDFVINDYRLLSRSSRLVIEWLAVTNQPCDVVRICKLFELTAQDWLTIVEETTKCGLLRISKGTASFTQPGLREIIYKNISPNNRKRLHVLVGRWSEENVDPDNLHNQLLSIAHHYHIADESAPFKRVMIRFLDLTINLGKVIISNELFETFIKTPKSQLKDIHRYRSIELLAENHLRMKRFDTALKFYQFLLNSTDFSLLGNTGHLDLRLGLCYSSLSNYKLASQYLTKAFKSLETTDPVPAADALSILAYSQYRAGNIEHSQKTTEKLVSHLSRIEEGEKLIRQKSKCSRLLILHRDYEKASEILSSIIAKYENPGESVYTLRVYFHMIRLLIKNNDCNSALKLINRIENLRTNDTPPKEIWRNHYLKAITLISSGQVQRGMDVFDQIELMIKANAAPLEQCRIALNILRIEYARGYYWRGIKRIRQTIPIARRMGNTSLQITLLSRLIEFRLMMRKPVVNLINMIEQLNKRNRHPLSEFETAIKLVEHFIQNGNFIDAYTQIKRCEVNSGKIEIDFPEQLLKLMKCIIEIKLNLGSTSMSKIEFWDGLQGSINDLLLRGKYNFYLMKLAIIHQKKSIARKHLKIALHYLNKMNATYLVSVCHEVYGHACLSWGDADDASKNLSQAKHINQSLGLPHDYSKIGLEIQLTDHAPKIDFPQIKDLAHILELLNGLEDPERINNKLLEMAIEAVNAERGIIFFNRDDAQTLSRRASIRIGEQEGRSISNTIVEQVFSSAEPIINNNAISDGYLSTVESIKLSRIRAVACLPIISKGEVEGVLYVDNARSIREYSDVDISYLKLLANLAGLILTQTRKVGSLKENIRSLRENLDKVDGYEEFKGKSDAVKKIYSHLKLLKNNEFPVLILGESGTGKELISRIIHRESKRAAKPFFAINCAAMPDQILESILFGHVKGAFTDAKSDHAGFFEQAKNGTIFLDEVDEMSISMQGKLLRVLQEGEFYRVGETRVSKTDVRIIAAGKDILPELIKEGKFRQDLYFRINVVKISLPPLRDRVEDVQLLIRHFILNYCKEFDCDLKGVRASAESALLKYNWPGNVREMQNVIKSVLVYAKETGWVEYEHLPEDIREYDIGSKMTIRSLNIASADFEKEYIRKVLNQCNWNITDTALKLKIHRSTLNKKMRMYGFSQENPNK